MSVIRIKSLHLRAFRSYLEDTIEFPQTGMVLLRGSNLDTKGGSGSGKSTIIEALNFALDFASFPSTELQSWLTDRPLQVSLELLTPLGDACITRGDKPKFSGAGRGSLTGASAASNALNAVLGIDAKLLKSLTCRSQRKAGMFLSLTDSEKKEFLTPILGINLFEKVAEDAGKRISEIQKKVAPAQAIFDTLRAEVGNEILDESKVRALSLECEILSNKVIEAWQGVVDIELDERQWRQDQETSKKAERTLIEATIQKIQSQPPEPHLAAELGAYNNDLIEAERRTSIARKSETTKESERLKNLRSTSNELSELRMSIKTIQDLKERLHSCLDMMTAIDKQTCPTCRQSWTGEEASDRAVVLKDSANVYIQDITEFEIKHPNPEIEVSQLESLIETLNEPIDTSMSRRLGEAADFILLKIKDIEHAIDKKKSETIAGLKARLHISVEEASPYTTAWKRALDVHSGLEVKLAVQRAALLAEESKVKAWHYSQQKVKDAEAQFKELESTLKREQDFQDMFKDFLAAVFDEALAEISDETNHILSGVPNTANVTLQFRSETMTQKGTAKKSIIPVMTVNGHEAKLGSGCSGGMISSVELATDLAVRSVVSRRLGVRPGWIVLDEPFEGLGPIEKEGYLEIIREYGRDNLVIVVDHSSEFKEYFTQIVEIEYRNGISKVTKISSDN